MTEMDRTLKALSLILSYPTRELQAAMPEIGGVLAADTPARPLRHVGRCARWWTSWPAATSTTSKSSYVMLFDRSRTLSLNLFEHVHGESRDRGGAMVSLIETYRAGGFDPATSRTARPPAGAAGIPVHASLRRGAGNLGGRGPYLRGPRTPDLSGGKAHMVPCSPLFCSSPACKADTRGGGRNAGPARRRPRPISRRSTRSGRKAKCASAPTRTPAARRSATCSPRMDVPPAPRHRRGRRMMEAQMHNFLFGIYPYIALSVADRGLDRALRTRSLHLENLVVAALAPQAADPRVDPVPCRRPGDLRRPSRRPADADLGVRRARHQPRRQAAAGRRGRRHRRGHGRSSAAGCCSTAAGPIRASARPRASPTSPFWPCCWRSWCSGWRRSSSRSSTSTGTRWSSS